jgi:hypothetical protein
MKFKSMGGLKVDDGRLVNDRPDGISGLQEAIDIKSRVKKAKKVNLISEGIRMAESINEMQSYFNRKK